MHYNPALHRWINRDPIAESGGINLYTYVGNDPANEIDAFGFGVGHHYIPREVYDPLPEGPARELFKNATTGATDPAHGWSAPHADYNEALKKMWKDFLNERGIKDLKEITEKDAKDFLKRVRCSKDPVIRDFIEKVESQVIKKLESKVGAKVAKKLGGAALGKVPWVAVGFFAYDARTGGVTHAADNLLWPLSEIWSHHPETPPAQRPAYSYIGPQGELYIGRNPPAGYFLGPQ